MVNTLDFSNNKSFQDARTKKKKKRNNAWGNGSCTRNEILIYTASYFHGWTTGFLLGVEWLLAWPIIAVDIKQFYDNRYRPFSKSMCR